MNHRPITRLFVLYDARCSFCVECRRWLARQHQLVPLVFVPGEAVDEQWRRRLPSVDIERELTVVADNGAVFAGPAAWILCLWSLEAYRSWAMRLSSSGSIDTAKWAFSTVSKRRSLLSRLTAWYRSEYSLSNPGADCQHCHPDSADCDGVSAFQSWSERQNAVTGNVPAPLEPLVAELSNLICDNPEMQVALRGAAVRLWPIHQAVTRALDHAGLCKSVPEVELAIRGVLIAMAAEVLSPEDVDAIVDFPG
ncbi:MAG: DUF393 domain-containing protein, partial [Proteobacteria bacterium]|nr:DUF393 domain-containing protein [Pseudomonadota bacterium]